MSESPFRETIAEVRETLLGVAAEVDTWFDRPEEVRCYRRRRGGWTIDEVLEHITLTNQYLLLVIRKSTSKAIRRAGRGASIRAGESNLRLLDPIARSPGIDPSTWSPRTRRDSHPKRTDLRFHNNIFNTLRFQFVDLIAALGGK
ncbi:hypothetical protein [Singulisphaera sp. PoT]|uniref:hypothetical protein n=1 Tax=Singulisphaera sp. PoT TaxID=3411797 RepID=UPI003BF484B3